MAGESGDLLDRGCIPDTGDLVAGVGGRRDDNALPVGRIRSVGNVLAKIGQYGELHAAGHVPDVRRVVKGGGDDAPPVGRERGVADGSAMAGKHGERLGRVRVPDARGLVFGGGNDAPTIGRERSRQDESPWPERTAIGLAVAASQIRAVWSPEAVTMRRPSGENAAENAAG